MQVLGAETILPIGTGVLGVPTPMQDKFMGEAFLAGEKLKLYDGIICISCEPARLYPTLPTHFGLVVYYFHLVLGHL